MRCVRLAGVLGPVAAVAVLTVACGAGRPGAALTPAGGLAPAPPAVDRAGLERGILDLLAGCSGEAEASVWAGGLEGPWYEREADVWRPAASSIKTAYLIELFDRHATALDRPLPGSRTIVGDPAHPAIAHFDSGTQAEILARLADATVRQVGVAMVRGTGVSNAVYNAAANLTTAAFDGPEAFTAAIHRRHPSFAGLAVRRYMLAARDVTGDNEATAAGLAAVLQALARRDVPGVGADAIEAMREVMFVGQDRRRGRHYSKSGSLDSDPLARVRSGWYEGRSPTLVYVVMLRQPGPGSTDRRDAARRLEDAADRITELVVDTMLRAVRGR